MPPLTESCLILVNLWNFEISDVAFNIIDIKPANMEDLTEVSSASHSRPRPCLRCAFARASVVFG